ncbi:hypothetical protein ACJMK2_022154 [Sinanodonta woodiana]|uniref:Uncharacterized protein n=1 Tax=Sinanodonta woodiana TaxID=1069815 RepID=A0ABD3TIB2_SINWO
MATLLVHFCHVVSFGSTAMISNFPYTRVCSDQFLSGKPADRYDKKTVDWVTNTNLCRANVLLSQSAATDRNNRVLGRIKTRKRLNASETNTSDQDILFDEQIGDTKDHNTEEIQTDIKGN